MSATELDWSELNWTGLSRSINTTSVQEEIVPCNCFHFNKCTRYLLFLPSFLCVFVSCLLFDYFSYVAAIGITTVVPAVP